MTAAPAPDVTAVLVGGARTPIGRFQGALAGVDPVDLGAHAVAAALARAGGLRADYVAMGDVPHAAHGQKPGRRAAGQGRVAPPGPRGPLHGPGHASTETVRPGAC